MKLSPTLPPILRLLVAGVFAAVLCGQPLDSLPIPEDEALSLWFNQVDITATEVRLAISFNADNQHSYVVEYRDDLEPFGPCDHWRPVPFAPHNFGIVFITNRIDAPSRFYQVRRIDQPFSGLYALLQNDTGADGTDGLTSDPTITGLAVPPVPDLRLQAGLDNPAGPFVTLQALTRRQHFLLDRADLEAAFGSAPPDGPHTLYLRMADAADNPLADFAVPFTLDATPPTVTLGLDPANAWPLPGSPTTAQDQVTLVGQTEPGLTIELLNTPWTTVADPAGLFRFENVPLAVGANTLAARALDAACNEGSGELTVTRLSTADCLFADGLPGWQVDVAPPLAGQTPGNVTAANCIATLTEGDSFVVALIGTFTAPATQAALEIQFFGPTFDTSSDQTVKDAFEIALVDDQGRPLTYVIGDGRDACFNLTEGEDSAALAPGVSFTPATSDSEPSTVSISLADFFAGQSFRLICRLVNNDGDPNSTVSLVNAEITAATTGPGLLLASNGARSRGRQSALPWSPASAELRRLTAAATARREPRPTESTAPRHNRRAIALASDNPPDPAQPSLTVDAPPEETVAGSAIVLTGRAQPGAASSAPRVTVIVNGQAVSALDASGRFFNRVTIAPGENTFTFTAQNGAGNASSATVTVFGTEPADSDVDFSILSDVSSSLTGEWGRTSFNERDKTLFADLSLRNAGQYAVQAPLLLGIAHLSDPSVRVANPDGVTPEGIPYFDFSGLIPSPGGEGQGEGGLVLGPQATTAPRSLAFLNPRRTQFTFDLVVLGQLNRPPAFTSVPVIEAIVGQTYHYPATATDPDNDPLTFALVTGPVAAEVTRLSNPPSTGGAAQSLLTSAATLGWTPTSADVGSHDIRLRVQDGHGGWAEQAYLLSVTEAPPNRPPYFTSIPLTYVQIAPRLQARVVVANDEWTLSDRGFSTSPDVGEFAVNVARFLTRKQTGSLLAYSPDFSFNGQRLPEALAAAGFTYTVSTDLPFTLESLLQYDAVFLAGPPVDNEVVIDYLAAGRGCYLAGGTGYAGGAAETAASWSALLNSVGLAFQPSYNGFFADISIVSTHPIFNGVTTLFEYNGNSIRDLDLNDNRGTVVAQYNGQGLYAVFDGIFPRSTNTYKYAATAFDPDSDSLVFSLPTAPAGMSLDPLTGIIRWSPTVDQIGDHNVSVKVSDGRGGTATQSYVIRVLPDPANHPPVIVSEPVTKAVIGLPYTYDVDAIDPDNDPLTYSLTAFPGGMAIDPASGLIAWSPPNPDKLPQWSCGFGSGGYEVARAAAVDDLGNVYVTGTFGTLVDFDPGPGVYSLQGNPNVENGFLLKLDPNGKFIWVRGFVGKTPSNVLGLGVAVDQQGNVYTTGRYVGTGVFGTGGNQTELTSAGGVDAYLVKLDTSGNLLWARSIGGVGNDEGRSVACDPDNNVFLCGAFENTITVAATTGGSALASAGMTDGYLIKYSADGNAVWARRFGDVGDDWAFGTAVGPDGDAYVTGYFKGQLTITPDPGYSQLTSIGGTDGYFLRFSHSGEAVSAHSFGTANDDVGFGIAVDRFANVYVAGYRGTYAGGGIFDNYNPGSDNFALIYKFDAVGSLDWSRQYGSTGDNRFINVTVDCPGYMVYLAGWFEGTTDFNPSGDPFPLTSLGDTDACLLSLRADGTFSSVRRVGGSQRDEGVGIALNRSGHLIMTGDVIQPVRLDPGNLPLNATGGLGSGSKDAFVVSYSEPQSCADVSVRVEDGRGGSDQQQFTIEVTPEPILPDLIVGNVDRAAVTVDPQTLTAIGTVTATVTNLGPGIVSGPFDVLFFEDANYNGAYDPGTDTQLGVTTVQSPLASGATAAVTAQIAGTVSFPGTFIWAFVDSGNAVKETNEANNLARSVADCKDPSSAPLPDLTSCCLRINQAGAQTTITARVGNAGELPVDPGVRVAFYNGDPKSGGVSIGVASTAARIEPGHFEDVSLTIDGTSPADLWVVADDDGTGKGQVNECDETNNTYHVPGDSLGSGEISGTVFNDLSGDGTWQVRSEPELSGMTVYLDLNGNGMRDPGEPFSVTAPDPRSVSLDFDDLPANTILGNLYRAQGVVFENTKVYAGPFCVSCPNVIGGLVEGPMTMWFPRGISRAQIQIDKDGFAADRQPLARFFDVDDNLLAERYFGQGPYIVSFQPEHALIFKMQLGSHIPPSNTDSFSNSDAYDNVAFDDPGGQGRYSFRNLPPGGYSVRIEHAANWSLTMPAAVSYSIVLADEQVAADLDFGLQQSLMPNRAPGLTSSPPTSATAGQDYVYMVLAADPDNDALTYELLLKPAGMAIDGLRGTVVWRPTSNQLGDNPVTLKVADGQGATVIQSFTVFVRAANLSPQITSRPTGPAVVGQPWQYVVRAQDADGDTITFQLDAHPSGMSFYGATVSWTPAAGDVGTQHVAVTASDGQDSTTQSFDLPVVVSAQNHAPVIASRPPTSVRFGDTYVYSVQASDPDGDPLTFSLPTAPADMTIDSAGVVTWKPTGLGASDVELRVSDGRAAVIQKFSVVVATQRSNQPPSITSSPPSSVVAGNLYQYAAVAVDPDNDPLAWSLDQKPDGMSVDPQQGLVVWAPTMSQLGANGVTLRVMDSQGGWASQSFTVTVRAVNLPPQITSVPPTQAATNQAYVYAVIATDPDGDVLTFSLPTAPVNMTIDAGSGLIEWTPDDSQLGTNLVVVRVEDGQGGVAEQPYEVVVSAEGNRSPVITSEPTMLAAINAAYTYQVTVTDPDGDTLHFVLLAAPSDMTIDAGSGLVFWQPQTIGTYTVTVAAADPAGSGGTQTFALQVVPVNHSPKIDSRPVQTVMAGAAYRYDVRATDPDGDVLTYALTGPTGMTIDQLGRVAWSPQVADAGEHLVIITVTDPLGESIEQRFNLIVTADTTPPFVRLGRGADHLPVGAILDLTAVASDNSGPVTLALTFGGVAVPLDARGQASLVLATPGTFEILAKATDAAGNVGQDSFQLTVTPVVVDNELPVVELTAPAADTVVTAPIPITGTASDDNLVFYKLEVGPLDGSTLTEIGRGDASVVNDVLGRLDPSGLANDSYRLVLTAQDAGGNIVSTETTFSVAGELKIGNFRLSFTDLSIPVNGVPIIVGRTYDSLEANNVGDFGYGWRFEFRDARLRTSLPKPEYLEDDFGDVALVYPAMKAGTRVYVTLPGGRREGFTFRPQRMSGFGGMFFFQPYFEADPGVTSHLGTDTYTLIVQSDGSYYSPNGLPYNPEDSLNFGGNYYVTTREGLTFRLDAQTGHMQVVSDANANTLTFAKDAITSSTGVKVTIGRDPQGRITSVKDPAGKEIKYQYDAAGNLVSVTDRESNQTQFKYEGARPHYLTEIIDPLGRSGVRTEYDDQGRLVELKDAANNAVKLFHDPDHDLEQVVDALGNTNTFVYDDRGNVVQELNALGGLTQREYDGNNNMTLEVDALGNTNRFEYDNQGNVLKHTDPLGNVTFNSYQEFKPGLFDQIKGMLPFKRLKSTVDPLGNTTQNSYDGAGNLTSTTDALGKVTRYEYDGAGNQTKITDAAGKVTQFEYDGAGRLTQQTDALGNVTTYTYDANGNQLTQTSTLTTSTGLKVLVTSTAYDVNGHPTSVTDAAGNVTQTEYDALGKTTATIDALGHRTEFAYDDRGQLVKTTFADGTTSQLTYDAAGHRTSSTDRAGRITYYQYDKLGRLVATTYPDATPDDLTDNPRSLTYYDLAGRVIVQTDEASHSTWFGYDAAGRQTSVTNALGAVTRSEYDTAGRKAADLDPLGRKTQFAYDALGRRLKTVFADNTTKQTTYDALGRVTAETDQAGVTTQFEYDASGRLTAVADALGARTEYGYNEQGNLISQKDANGHVTQYEYETCCQRSAVTLPLGQRSTTLYNAVNNVVSITDFNGRTIQFQYDVNNRLKSKQFPDGTAVQFAYTATGRRQTITDPRGVTTFEYDARDRLLKRTDPDGRFVAYTYDAAGNRTLLVTGEGDSPRPLGGEGQGEEVITNSVTRYTFDALNRLTTVTDPQGGVTRYTYDAANNVVRMELPNGTVRVNSYDALNRVNTIEHAGPGGAFASYQYTLGPTGNRTEVRELDGRVVSYNYDALYRLVQESINDPSAGNRTITYTMDPVGNRLTRDDSAEGQTTYTYDANDQLLTETLAPIPSPGGEGQGEGDPVVITYTYDANGNTLSRSNANETNEYDWDAENHLVGFRRFDATHSPLVTGQYAYDAGGIRVASTVTEAGDTTATAFLIDANRPFAQVLEEWQTLTPSLSHPMGEGGAPAPGEGTLVASYTYGPHPPISQLRAGVRSYFHADHLGSTRALTDQTGSPTDRYNFDAYGRLIGPSPLAPNPSTPYLFAGEQRDQQLGLDYLRARYLRVSLARFYGKDSFEGYRVRPSGVNRYVYAEGNPVNTIDPSGQQLIFISGVPDLILSLWYEAQVRAVDAARGFAAYCKATSLIESANLSIFLGQLAFQVPYALREHGLNAGFAVDVTSYWTLAELKRAEVRVFTEAGSGDTIIQLAFDTKSRGLQRYSINWNHPIKSEIQWGLNRDILSVKICTQKVATVALTPRLFTGVGLSGFKLGLEARLFNYGLIQVPLVEKGVF